MNRRNKGHVWSSVPVTPDDPSVVFLVSQIGRQLASLCPFAISQSLHNPHRTEFLQDLN